VLQNSDRNDYLNAVGITLLLQFQQIHHRARLHSTTTPSRPTISFTPAYDEMKTVASAARLDIRF